MKKKLHKSKLNSFQKYIYNILTYYLFLLVEADGNITLNVDCLFKLKRVKIKVLQTFRQDEK